MQLEPLEGENAAPDVMRLRSELHEMQKALHHTQAALVSKYQGRGNRFVGGAQFRTNERNPRPLTKGAPGPTACVECSTLKAHLKRAKQDEEGARGEGCLLRAKLAEYDAVLAAARQSVGSMRTSLTASEAENASLRAAAAEAAQNVHRATAGLSRDEAALAATVEDLRTNLAHMHAQLMAAQSADSSQGDAMLRAELDEALDGRARAEADATERGRRYDDEHAARRRAEGEGERHASAAARACTGEAAARDAVRVLEAELDEARARLAELHGQGRSADDDALARAHAEAANYLEELNAARRALADCEGGRAREAARAEGAEARVRELEAMLREREGRAVSSDANSMRAAAAAAEQMKLLQAQLGERDQQLAAMKVALKEVKCLAAEERARARSDLVNAQERAEEMRVECDGYAQRVADLEADVAADAARREHEASGHAATQQALATELTRADAALALAATEADRVRAEHAVAGADAADEAQQRASAAAEAKAAAEALAFLRAENEALHAELASAKARAAQHEAAAERSDAEVARLAKELKALHAANAKREDVAALAKKLKEQLAAAESAQQAAVATARVLTDQLEAARKEAAEAERRAKELKTGLREQLDDAAQSSVRLCVVAPTVNVTFGEQVLSYKAPLPKEKIRNSLELQVLPAFAKSFIQEREGLAPDGTSMDDWLREMTVTMQGSIETHLGKVFRDSAANAS